MTSVHLKIGFYNCDMKTIAFLLPVSVRRVHDQGRSREVGPIWSGALEAPVIARGS